MSRAVAAVNMQQQPASDQPVFASVHRGRSTRAGANGHRTGGYPVPQPRREPQFKPPVPPPRNILTQKTVDLGKQPFEQSVPVGIPKPVPFNRQLINQANANLMPPQQFSQISKNATNLLNNIYEKHLLSQTTFESKAEIQLSYSKQQKPVIRSVAKQRPQAIYEDGPEPQNHHLIVQKPKIAQKPIASKNTPQLQFQRQLLQQKLRQIQDMNSSIRLGPIGGNLAKHEDVDEMGGIHFPSSPKRAPSAAPVSIPAPTQGDEEPMSCVFNNVGQKFEYRNSKINLMLETAQAVAAAAYIARAAQAHKVGTSEGGRSTRSRATEMSAGCSDRGGFCGVLQRAPPPMPAIISRRLANRENAGLGKVKVMLRVTGDSSEASPCEFMQIDKKKRQVTLTDPATAPNPNSTASSNQERGPMVSAPKMFAFDGLFTTEDLQNDVCTSALSEVIPAVLDGSDGCLLALGHPGAGQSKLMLGSIINTSELGAIPCAISWLYKGINERRQKSGARFSVRVSCLGVSATKPGSSARDLLAAHATETDDSPGVYLRDDFLGGPTELRAPTAERAALFLDAALSGRSHSSLDPAIIFTLHVYQYSLAGKGGVAGGRSRLHLIDLGGCANRCGGLPLSGVGNVLLAILSGQRHPPNRDHPLTPLLKDCLAPLTCHVSILAHVSFSQNHTDALTTIQLASRIHRMRRRKHRFPASVDKSLGLNANNGQSTGSSEGPDPSSSDLSADTVIYIGPCDDQTDNEHPPVFLPSLSSGDNRCAMQKVLKGSVAEKPTKSPVKKVQKLQSQLPHRTDSLKRTKLDHSYQNLPMSAPNSPAKQAGYVNQSQVSSMIPSPYKYSASMSTKGSNVPTPKGSPLRRPNASSNQDGGFQRVTEEKWIDGPRVSRSKVAEARHLMREINHVKKCETWVDGPKTETKPTLGNPLAGTGVPTTGYGFMDSHKKSMIRQWVENQTSQVFQDGSTATSTPASPHHANQQFKVSKSEEEQRSEQNVKITSNLAHDDTWSEGGKRVKDNPLSGKVLQEISNSQPLDRSMSKASLISDVSKKDLQDENGEQEEEDQDSGPSEVPPALPLIDCVASREMSHESIHLSCSRQFSRESIQMMDCGLQVTEEEIAKSMSKEHPLSALSHGDMSVVSSFHAGDTFSDCVIGDTSRHQFDQLARLREIFTSQLALAEVTPVFRLGINDVGSVYSEPAYRFQAGPGSVCSEPAYRPPSPRCRDCRQSISKSPSETSLPSLNGIVAIAGMEQYASLRHPDGASDPNLQKTMESLTGRANISLGKSKISSSKTDLGDVHLEKGMEGPNLSLDGEKDSNIPLLSQTKLPQLPLLPLSTPEAYDSGHDSTPRTSKHSGISRRAESGYHSIATAHDSDGSSFGSAGSRQQKIHAKKSKRQDKSLCRWLRNPFNCTYPDTEGEVSDF